MLSIHSFNQWYKFLFTISAMLMVCSLLGCGGGVLKFAAGAKVSVDVKENTSSTVWKASVSLEGPGNLSGLSYSLSGPDQDKFFISSATGEVSFREMADYEHPTDADLDNEYRLIIEARANNQRVEQDVTVRIENAVIPKIQLIKPLLNENLGNKTDVQISAVARLYDAESNSPLNFSSVNLNGLALVQDANNPQLFHGEITVPAAGMEVSLEGKYDQGQKIQVSGKLFNKLDAVSPDYVAINPSSYLFFLDRTDGSVGKLPLDNKISYRYIQHSLFTTLQPVFDFNSLYQTVYTTVDKGQGITELYAFPIGSATPNYFSAGCTSDKILSIAYDSLNKRILVVTQNSGQASADYKVLALALDESTGFVNNDTPGHCSRKIEGPVVGALSLEMIKGAFKQLAFHRLSGTFVVADERVQAGQIITMVQGFSETGEKRFQATVGPDISNITINNAMGIIYVAENHSSVDGKIKTINVATGEVKDLLDSLGGNLIGAYSDIRIDNPNQLLYIADAVSDDFFVVNLKNNTLTNLQVKRIPDVVSD